MTQPPSLHLPISNHINTPIKEQLESLIRKKNTQQIALRVLQAITLLATALFIRKIMPSQPISTSLPTHSALQKATSFLGPFTIPTIGCKFLSLLQQIISTIRKDVQRIEGIFKQLQGKRAVNYKNYLETKKTWHESFANEGLRKLDLDLERSYPESLKGCRPDGAPITPEEAIEISYTNLIEISYTTLPDIKISYTTLPDKENTNQKKFYTHYRQHAQLLEILPHVLEAAHIEHYLSKNNDVDTPKEIAELNTLGTFSVSTLQDICMKKTLEPGDKKAPHDLYFSLHGNEEPIAIQTLLRRIKSNNVDESESTPQTGPDSLCTKTITWRNERNGRSWNIQAIAELLETQTTQSSS